MFKSHSGHCCMPDSSSRWTWSPLAPGDLSGVWLTCYTITQPWLMHVAHHRWKSETGLGLGPHTEAWVWLSSAHLSLSGETEMSHETKATLYERRTLLKNALGRYQLGAGLDHKGLKDCCSSRPGCSQTQYGIYSKGTHREQVKRSSSALQFYLSCCRT